MSVSHSHGIDLEVAKNIVEKNWAYFGIIASSRKSAMIKQQLIEAGFDREKIAKIDMPAGIEIKVEKPEEIALSVLAKIIDLRNRKRA